MVYYDKFKYLFNSKFRVTLRYIACFTFNILIKRIKKPIQAALCILLREFNNAKHTILVPNCSVVQFIRLHYLSGPEHGLGFNFIKNNMATSVERWMCDELSKLGLPASEDNAK